MPHTEVINNFAIPETNTTRMVLYKPVFGGTSFNSTTTELFQIEDETSAQADLSSDLLTIASQQEYQTTNIVANLKYLNKSGKLLPSRRPSFFLITTLKTPTIKFIESSKLSTNVLPGAISSNWNGLADGGLSERTYQRLLELASLPAGWNGTGSLGMDASSLWSFIAFWREIKQISIDPELVLTPSGHIQAEWYKDNKHFLEIDFRGNKDKSYFALIDGRKAEFEGATSTIEIINFIKSYKNSIALTWRYE